MVYKKVVISDGVRAIISILDIIYDDKAKSVRTIMDKLLKLKPGDQIDQLKVDEIFGKWATYTPTPNDPRHVVEFLCAYIKDEMFK